MSAARGETKGERTNDEMHTNDVQTILGEESSQGHTMHALLNDTAEAQSS